MSFIIFLLLIASIYMTRLTVNISANQVTAGRIFYLQEQQGKEKRTQEQADTSESSLQVFISIVREMSFLNRFARSIILAGIISVGISLLKLDHTNGK